MEDIKLDIKNIKQLRQELDAINERILLMPGSAEKTLARRHIQEGRMWLGEELARINKAYPSLCPDPYPNSRNPANTIIDPPADKANANPV